MKYFIYWFIIHFINYSNNLHSSSVYLLCNSVNHHFVLTFTLGIRCPFNNVDRLITTV